MNLILMGAPGAGKGTQAEKISAKWNIPAISTGDILRAAIKEGTELGQTAKAFIDDGKLVPDDIVIGIIKEYLMSDVCRNGFILDGFPRNTAQAEVLDKELSDMGIALDAALLVDVKADVIINRLSSRRTCRSCGYTAGAGVDVCPRCGGEMYQRDDDKPETIKKRLDTYESQTAPLVGYYREHGILKEVDGDRPVDEVYADVKVLLGL